MNLFWPVYKNLEREVLDLARFIHFSDNQVGVYSMRIADIIIRCVVEIESISKELYKTLGGSMELRDKGGKKRDIYFDTDCLNLLEKNWGLSKKVIKISSPIIYFEEDQNRIFCPLHKAFKRTGAKWNKAYQAIKHDRAESLKKYANIRNMLLAMGALYILNLYYKDESFGVQDKVEKTSFDERVGSELFSVSFANIGSISALDSYETYIDKAKDFGDAIYIKRYNETTFLNIQQAIYKINETAFKMFCGSKEGAELLKRKVLHQEAILSNFADLVKEAGGKGLQEIINDSIRMETTNLSKAIKNVSYEYVLNKQTRGISF